MFPMDMPLPTLQVDISPRCVCVCVCSLGTVHHSVNNFVIKFHPVLEML